MRLLPIIAAATIGLFATAATAQNMNTTDPNSAPGASSTGGKPMRPNAGEVKKMDTTDPNSAPGASATGGKVRAGGSQNMDTVQTGNPNRPSAGQTTTGDSSRMTKKKSHKKKKHSM
jgi:hypothetical protein